MRLFKKKLPPPPPPKETERRVIMQIIASNNRTDKEFVFNSYNNYGLTWKIFGDNSDMLLINQNTKLEKDNWESRARLVNYSIVAIQWKTLDLTTNLIIENE